MKPNTPHKPLPATAGEGAVARLDKLRNAKGNLRTAEIRRNMQKVGWARKTVCTGCGVQGQARHVELGQGWFRHGPQYVIPYRVRVCLWIHLLWRLRYISACNCSLGALELHGNRPSTSPVKATGSPLTYQLQPNTPSPLLFRPASSPRLPTCR